MQSLTLPCRIFQTQRRWNDMSAADMRCGDLSAQQLRQHFYLTQVSTQVDPFTSMRLTPFDAPQHRFTQRYPGGRGKPLSPAQCAALLFDEMRSLSWTFSLYGPYRQLINRMISHMQHGAGRPFHDVALNMALKRHIEQDHSPQASRKAISDVIQRNVQRHKFIPSSIQPVFYDAIKETRLPKFTRLVDCINGLGITVHDIYAIQIHLQSFVTDGKTWHATVKYQAQDHFGLDDSDIMKKLFRQFSFFKIWFVLQRYEHFAFRPFMTNMEATITLQGNLK